MRAGNTNNRPGSARLRRSAGWADSTACREAGEPVGTYDAHSAHAVWHAPRRYSAVRGLKVSRGDVLKNLLVRTQLGNQALELRVLLLQFLQPLGLVHLQAALYLAPAVIGLLCDSSFLASRRVRLAVCPRPFNLPKHAHNLLRCGLPASRRSKLIPFQFVSLSWDRICRGGPRPARFHQSTLVIHGLERC
jgi:hypothetical protein